MAGRFGGVGGRGVLPGPHVWLGRGGGFRHISSETYSGLFSVGFMALFQLHVFPQNLLTTHIFFLKKYKHVHPSWSHNIVAKFVLNI